MRRASVLFSLFVLAPICSANAADPTWERKEDVIYGRKDGLAMTMDVFKPKANANGLGLVYVVSGGWFSAHAAINPGFVEPFTKRGYTVFAVVHGSQPKYNIQEVLQDMHRSIRYIRAHAKEYGIDPERIGIYGGSAGGHLSLMQGTAGKPGDPKAKDAVDRESSRIASVACFFPPTDFFNYGKEGQDALGRGILKAFGAPFDFQEMNSDTKRFDDVKDEEKLKAIGKEIAPAYHVTSDDPPSLIIHGDADKLVPIQQAELIMEKFKKAGVKAELIVKPGQAHGWPDLGKDLDTFADWFDKTLKTKKP